MDDTEAARRYAEQWTLEFAAGEQTEMKAQSVEPAAEEEEESRKRYTFRVGVAMTKSQGETSMWVYEGYLIEVLENGVWKIDGFKVRKSHEE